MWRYGRRGAFPERLLNLCAQNRLAFWGLSWGDETSFTFRIRLKDLPRLRQYAQWAMCAIHEAGRRGGLAALLRWRRRWGFVAGAVVAFLAMAVLSRFVLVVEVTGNESVPSAIILSELQRLGVKPGAYGPALDRPPWPTRPSLPCPSCPLWPSTSMAPESK